jgi:hypothetical protein
MFSKATNPPDLRFTMGGQCTLNTYVYYIIYRHQDIFMMDNIPTNSVDPEELVKQLH